MKVSRFRSISISLCFLVALQAPAWSLAPTAGGIVRGTVTALSGPLPPGLRIRLTPLSGAGGNPVLAAVGEDGAYEFLELQPGEYRVELIAPNDEVIQMETGTSGRLTVTDSKPAVTNLVVNTTLVPEPALQSGPVKKKRKAKRLTWSILGGVAGAALLAGAGGGGDNSNDPPISPSTP